MKSPWRRILGVSVAVGLALSCSSDSQKPDFGFLEIHASLEGFSLRATGDAPHPDSLRAEVRDSGGGSVASGAVALPDSVTEGTLRFEVAAGGNLQVLVQADGATALGRGATHFGRQDGLGVDRGRTTQVDLPLQGVVPGPPIVDGQPAAPTYEVRWNRIPGAIGYLLRESSGGVTKDYALSDTFRTFTPGLENGTARLAEDGLRLASRNPWNASSGALPATIRTYRVRAGLPLGSGTFSDSTTVDLDDWYDLPRVTGVVPADSAVGVRDDVMIRITFDRVMERASLVGSGISLTKLRTGSDVLCWHEVEAGDSVAVLGAIDPLDRGEWYRIRVSTGVRDARLRPLDQDPVGEGLQALVSDFQVEVYDPLRVIEVFPGDGATGVEPNVTVFVRFNRAIEPSSVTDHGFTVSDSGGPVDGDRHPRDQGRRLEFWASRPLVYGIEHEIQVDTTLVDAERLEPLDQDPEEPGLQPFHAGFRTMLQPRGPRVVGSDPLAGEPHHPIWEPILITLDRPIDPASAIPGSSVIVQVRQYGQYYNVAGQAQTSGDSLQITFVPGARLIRDTLYRVTVVGGDDGIRDAHGIPLDQDPYTPGYQPYMFTFEAEQNVRVDSMDPGPNETGVAWDAVVEIEFSMPIQPASANSNTIHFLQSGMHKLVDFAVTPDSTRVTLTPRELLESYLVYEVIVTTDVRSRRGGPFDQEWSQDGHQEFRSSFRADYERERPRVDSVSPQDGTTGVPIDGEVLIVFTEPVRPDGVRQYTYVTRVDSLGARVDGQVTPSADSLSALFEPAASLDYSTDYHVHVLNWVVDRFGNRLDQDPQQDGWQVFHSVFRTQNEQDRPRVIAIDSPGGLTAAPVDGPIWIDFNESMDRPSIPEGLRIETGGSSIAGTVAFENEDKRIVWTPVGLLHPNRVYGVHVDSLATDLVGNPLDQIPLTDRLDPFEGTFRTEADTVGPFVETVSPANGSTEVTVEVSPVLMFNEPVDPETVTAQSVFLSDSAGTTVGSSLALSAEDRALTITPDSPLAFYSRYELHVGISVTDTLGNLYDDNPAVPGNQPFSSWFRTQRETVPPQVLSLLLDGSPGNISVSTDVRVVFSEPVTPSTINAATFQLLDGEGVIAGSRTVAASGDTATMNPTGSLAYGRSYEVRVAGVEDLAGNALDQDPMTAGEQPYTATFHTQSDLYRPKVARSEPADGAFNVDPAAVLRIVFNEPMDTHSFTAYNPGLFLQGDPVTTNRIAEPGDSSFVFLHEDLERGQTYQFKAGTELQDLAGNFLDQDPGLPGGQMFVASFQVGDRPVADAGPGDCSIDATGEASFDGSDSFDPDGELVQVIWNWGDGSADTLDAATGLMASHDYACADDAGCDDFDNDGDGEVDEEGDDGCDESYRVVLTVVDDHGYRSADTTGVSFCVFRVRASLPDSGAVDVDTLMSPMLTLTRSCDPATLDSTAVWMTIAEGDTIPLVLTIEDDEDRIILLDPHGPLLPDTSYEIHAGSELRGATGDGLDQDPCAPGAQEFVATFRTVARPMRPRRSVPAPRPRPIRRTMSRRNTIRPADDGVSHGQAPPCWSGSRRS